jgi:hypothetical protein
MDIVKTVSHIKSKRLKVKEVMNSIDYTQSSVEPNVFIQTTTYKSLVVIYVDDGDVFSTKEIIDTLIKALGKDFKIKSLCILEHFFGCHIIESQKKGTL